MQIYRAITGNEPLLSCLQSLFLSLTSLLVVDSLEYFFLS